MKHVKCKLCGQEHPLGGCPIYKMQPRGLIQRIMEQAPKALKKPQKPAKQMRPGRGGRRGS